MTHFVFKVKYSLQVFKKKAGTSTGQTDDKCNRFLMREYCKIILPKRQYALRYSILA